MLLYPILYNSFSCFINRTKFLAFLYLRLNEEPRTKSSFTPFYERLDFRGITDAAGTTFLHSRLIMVWSFAAATDSTRSVQYRFERNVRIYGGRFTTLTSLRSVRYDWYEFDLIFYLNNSSLRSVHFAPLNSLRSASLRLTMAAFTTLSSLCSLRCSLYASLLNIIFNANLIQLYLLMQE